MWTTYHLNFYGVCIIIYCKREWGKNMEPMESISKKWNEIKETLRKEYELSDISFSTWIEPLNFYEVKDNIVTILIPSDQAHALNYITSKYRSFFQVTISEMMDHTYDINFIL